MLKPKKGQKVRVKDLQELPLNTSGFPRTGHGTVFAGQIGNIIEVGGQYVVLDIESTIEGGQIGIFLHEIEYYIDPKSIKNFKVSLKEGAIYSISCTENSMKELAEFIGDDNLESIIEKNA